MVESVVLDSGPLSKLVHPRTEEPIVDVFDHLQAQRVKVFLPEIADYEVRRELLHRKYRKSLSRLDQLKQALRYLPINTSAMLRAAELWADLRQRGRPTADPKALDGDVILVAQAEQVSAAILTENVDHISLIWQVIDWREIAANL